MSPFIFSRLRTRPGWAGFGCLFVLGVSVALAAPPDPSSPVASATAATGTVRVTVGFSGQQVETRILAPNLVEKPAGEWVTSDTEEVRQAHSADRPGKKTWSPNPFLPVSIPARPGQMDGIPQSREFPVPFRQPVGETTPPPVVVQAPQNKREAVDAFLAKRPDIGQFIRDNTGITDPVKILEKWVYDVMQSEDSDWAEGKAILEKEW